MPKATSIRCQDLDFQGKPNQCDLEIRGSSGDEVIRLMRSHAQIIHQTQFLPEQLLRHLKEAT